MSKLKALIAAVPEPVRLLIRDALEGAITAVIALNLAIPGSLIEAKAEGLTLAVAAGGAIIAVLRRELLPLILGLFSTPDPTIPPA